MPMTQTVNVLPATSLADLNAIIVQKEGVLGALATIGNAGGSTALTFNVTPQKPAKNAVITPDVGGAPSVPNGNTSFSHDSVYIAGALTPASASRPN